MAKKEDEWVIRDHLFHRRVSEVRNKVNLNLNEAEALELIKTGAASGGSLFAQPGKPDVNPFSDEEVDRRAFFDEQTPTYNFRYLLRTFRRELVRAKRYKRSVSICIVIVDTMAYIAKHHGTLAVDVAIQMAAETLIRSCRADVDMVGRYGDDRFLLVLPETPGHGATVLAERLCKKFDNMVIPYQWYKLKLSISVGIAHFPGHGGSVEELIAQADLAAETVQERGGNGLGYAPESPEPPGGAVRTV